MRITLHFSLAIIMVSILTYTRNGSCYRATALPFKPRSRRTSKFTGTSSEHITGFWKLSATSSKEGLEDTAPHGRSLPTATIATAADYRTTDKQHPYQLSSQQFIYMALTSTFITCLLIADVIGVKLFSLALPFPIFGFTTIEHTCGMLTFPITFLIGDIINEYFGSRAARNTVFLGFAMSALVFVMINAAQAMPYLDAPFNVAPAAFNQVFGSAKLMYVASITAFLLGSLADIWLFGVIKRITGGKLLWLRATGSTVISQVLDSFVVSYVAFSLGKTLTGQTAATLPEVLNIAATGYGLKFALAAAMTPCLYLFKTFISDKFGLKSIPVDDC